MSYLHNLFGCLLALFPFVCPRPDFADRQAAIKIQAKPISEFVIGDSSKSRFGALDFRGGLVLTSTYPSFGGISALRVQRDGERFIALTDKGSWLRGRIAYKQNRPEGIIDAVMAPMLDADGTPAHQWDTESIADDGDTLYVGIERTNRIVRFDYGKRGILARAQPVAVPPGIEDLPYNQGLEAMVFVPRKYPLGGALIAVSEYGLNEAGDIKAFLIGGPNPGMLAVRCIGGYSVSDAALLPGGDLLILERRYSLLNGITVRIRRIPLAEIRPGAVVDGPTIFEADMRCQIDNMEALSVHRARSGETVLTLMSDDNFSPIQRTLLLQFELSEK